MPTIAGHLPPPSRLRSRACVALGLAAAIAGGALAAGASAQSSVESKRAEVERIQGELSSIDARLEDAANAYNGARYRLDGIREDIRGNQRTLNATERALAVSRLRLAERLTHIYTTPQPSTIAVLVTSGSITEASERLNLLEQVGQRDGAMVRGIREDRVRLRTARAQLVKGRASAERQVKEAEAQRRAAAELLRQRQAVLSQAQGELAAALRAEEQREAQIAAQERARAVARQQEQNPTPAPSSASPSAPTAPSAPVAIPSGAGNATAASLALQFLGVPYRWGGASPSGFDCSGLASYVFAKIGKSVPHYTVAIWNAFPRVPRDQLQAGDMVFFRGLGHMGIYLGGDQLVHAPRTGDVVKVSSMSSRSDYVGAVRP